MRKEERKKKIQELNAWHHLYVVVWAYKELPGQRAYGTERQAGEGWPQGQWERELDKEEGVVCQRKMLGSSDRGPEWR